jgi:hypothetical protein
MESGVFRELLAALSSVPQHGDLLAGAVVTLFSVQGSSLELLFASPCLFMAGGANNQVTYCLRCFSDGCQMTATLILSVSLSDCPCCICGKCSIHF